MNTLLGGAGSLLVPAIVTVLFFVTAVARRVLLRSRSTSTDRPANGQSRGAAAGATEELHALLYPGKRIQLEQRQVELVLRDDEQDGAPPRTGIDLAGGTAVVRPPHRGGEGHQPGAAG
ncbi:DUF6191 domain-containing protein [Kitasatospora sp. NPDC006697]|uniref:DUF6191 domain-containing protein n=1 Tax=Kitasatospora sp. NPDC006697 TaxID=3364020 RepID=UPI00368B3648